jgi:alanyl-tRNA synthetase
MKITRKELIKKYINFFKEKGHSEIQNSSLVPENDPTVLFTTAGMHPLVPYLLGQDHPKGKKLINVQRCVRTGDIEEVGNTTHHTLFEMLGNWSLGDYFKKEAIEYTFEFLTKHLEIPIEKLAVSVFRGDKDAPKDTEAAETWEKLGIPKSKITYLSKKDNWWETPSPGPCGPDTEVFYWKPNDTKVPKTFDPENKNWVEIGNNVLMQYEKDADGKYTEAKQKNIDFGGGVERAVAILNGYEDNYQTEIWQPIIDKIEKLSKKSYKGNEREMRIIADHIKASIFIIADGVTPLNTEQGYVLRRLIRRAIRLAKKIGIPQETDITTPIVKETLKIYSKSYPHLETNKQKIIDELNAEEEKFEKTLDKGLKEFEKMVKKDNQITAKESFLLFQSYGFPIEMIQELANEKNIKVDTKGFQKEMEKHQELSRTASAGKFKSGLADNSDATRNLHTATHLLNEALRVVLKKPDLYQKGSNITPERLRFDFNFDRKLTPDEIQKTEDLVNQKIKANLAITCKTMSIKEAQKTGAQGIFGDKYDTNVKVYTIGNFSKELCAGPHANNTSELDHFKIKKESSSASGIRRIKAILE